ncbi:hypothetical protein NKR19_g9190 [Coniochaeta hoffmannii]|uniref:DUF3295 domain-containing protein n=1 Tax=Coniochaeta hoffmannii TaxID=91930 RepID=A0AA38R1Y4_9PEZI|nr:hypothetical protein NKR19_g9190 [Coniochaeta hoffmannii]
MEVAGSTGPATGSSPIDGELGFDQKEHMPNISAVDYEWECAIDDESSEWEDSDGDSGPSVCNNLEFKRIDSTTNLTSPRSLLTIALTQSIAQQPDHGAGSQSMPALSRAHTPPNGLQRLSKNSDGPLMMKNMKSVNEIPRSSPIPITTANGVANQPISSRTTRRTMLSEELTENLRRCILRERQQGSQKGPTPKDVALRSHCPAANLINTKKNDETWRWGDNYH